MFHQFILTVVASLSAVVQAAPGHGSLKDNFVPSHGEGPKLLEYNHVNKTLIYVPWYHMEMNCTHITPPLPEWKQQPVPDPSLTGLPQSDPSPTIAIDMHCTVFTRDLPAPTGTRNSRAVNN